MRRVLSEEEYLRILEGILRRDYYPTLPALLNPNEQYLTIEEFQAKFTSEDDHSFEMLVDKLNRERSKRYKRVFANNLKLLSASNESLLVENSSNDNYIEIRPSNTKFSNNAAAQSSKEGSVKEYVYNFVPMTPHNINNGNNMSPAGRNLLKSIRNKHINKEYPFGGSTPQKKSK